MRIASVGLVLVAGACILPDADLSDLPCPCSDGFVCNVAANRCVADEPAGGHGSAGPGPGGAGAGGTGASGAGGSSSSGGGASDGGATNGGAGGGGAGASGPGSGGAGGGPCNETALWFDGLDDVATFDVFENESPPFLTDSSEFGVGAWFEVESTASSGTLLGRGGTSNGFSLSLELDQGGLVPRFAVVQSNGETCAVDAPVPIAISEATQVIGSYEDLAGGAPPVLKIHIDGLEVATTPCPNLSLLLAGAPPLVVGSGPSGYLEAVFYEVFYLDYPPPPSFDPGDVPPCDARDVAFDLDDIDGGQSSENVCDPGVELALGDTTAPESTNPTIICLD